VFRWRTKDDPEALILSDTGVYWEDPTLDFTHHCPDVCAIFGIKKRKPEYPSFFVRKEGVRPRLIVELVSPNTRENDVETKVQHYHRVEIPMFVIADRQSYNDPWKLLGYAWRPDQYIPIPTDLHGRLWLDAVGLWLGADGTRLVCYDRDGTEFGDYTQVRRQLDFLNQAEQRAAQAEAKVKALEAELARLRGQ
jgi:Uma2 family endonuclease